MGEPRGFSMRMNEEEMRILRALYKNSGATGGLPSFVKQRVLDSKTVKASLKSIMEMERTLEDGLKYCVMVKELNEHYSHKLDIVESKFKLQLKKVATLKP